MDYHLIKNHCIFINNTFDGNISVETVEWDSNKYPQNIIVYKETVYEKQHVRLSKDKLCRIHCYFSR